MKEKKYKVPRAVEQEYETLQIRGVKKEYAELVKSEATRLGYLTNGAYMNALLEQVYGDVGERLQEEGGQGAKKAS